MKLLAKDPEDRYQSHEGVLIDLEARGNERKSDDIATNFLAGRYDKSRRFRIPDRLYGREEETRKLISIFNTATVGGASLVDQGNVCQFVLISGLSGIGKSALVSELLKPINDAGGFLATGKFDQLLPDRP